MPFLHGSQSQVWLDGLNLSGYLNAADWSTDQDTAETTAFGVGWKTYIAGPQGGKASFQGFYDPTMLDLENLLGHDWALNNGVLTYCPRGSAVGDQARLLSVATSSYAQSSPVGGVVGVKWDAMASAAIGTGEVLHPYAADTNTTTGAGRDGAAASATGWTAHLHVTGITGGGTWVVKLQDSTTNSGFGDVTGAAFTATAAKGGQRLVSATSTTALKRWVCYVATRTGGSPGDTLSFMLAYSRNS